MCGILGIANEKNIAEELVHGLKNLEYRGYDSSGIATINKGIIERRRAEGKIKNLEETIKNKKISGSIGIGHTRWATHGIPSENNAHPHITSEIALVHNGIIENYQELIKKYNIKEKDIISDTDTEIIAHIITKKIKEGLDPLQTLQTLLPNIEGTFAFCILFKKYPNIIVGTKKGSPLAIGIDNNIRVFGSDALAIIPFANNISYLDDGDISIIEKDNHTIYDKKGNKISREEKKISIINPSLAKGNFSHFMQKEIYEQPEAIANTLSSIINPHENSLNFPDLNLNLDKVNKIIISACGTAYYAAMVAKYWIEKLAKIPVETDIASELRYRSTPLRKGDLSIFISQSGETMDTLEALKYCKSMGLQTLSIVNVPDSTIARTSDSVIKTLAGPEIGVASTKAFTTQLITLLNFAIYLAKQKNEIHPQEESELIKSIIHLPSLINSYLKEDNKIINIANSISNSTSAIYIGRGLNYPIAMEGALKLKEISYIHSEGYAAGEMKHGPIALIDENLPVIAIAPYDDLFPKTASNIQEAIARGGRVIFISSKKGIEKMQSMTKLPFQNIEIPDCNNFTCPILYSIPMQLIAYHVAVIKGTDIDQPRNLAKSVTVE